MSVVAHKTKLFSLKEYLAFEEISEVKHEFLNGKIIEMPGGSAVHSRISVQITYALLLALEKKNKDFIVLGSDIKISIPKENKIVYADALVVCEKIEYMKGRTDVILNPILVVEVLSPSTEQYDRTDKFMLYKQLPSLQEYVLVKQAKPHINTFFKEKQNSWLDTVQEDLSKSIYFASIDCEISLSQVYRGVF